MRIGLRILFVIILFSSLASADERILSYLSDVTVNGDGSLLVRETIRVNAEHNQINHGIYRDFPTEYSDRFGRRYVVVFTPVAAERDNQRESWHLEGLSNGIRIYLGDSRTLVPQGVHTYVVEYTVTREIGFFSDHDELYWNVTGNGWGFAIDRASAIVHLPPGIAREAIRLDGFTGPQGSMEKALRTGMNPNNAPVFTTNRRLAPTEGLSIVVDFPKGYVHEPAQNEKYMYFLEDNRPMVIAVVGLFFVLVYYVVVWWRVGRDPQAGIIMPLYEPPAGFSPAAVRFLKRMAFDNKAFAAAMIDLAVKKQLSIQQDEKGIYTVVPATTGAAGNLTSDEKVLRDVLLGAGSELRLTQTHWQQVSAGVKSVKHALQTAIEKIYFFSHGSYMIPGVILTALTAIATTSSAPTSSKQGPAIFLCVWLSFWTVGVALLLTNAARAWKNARHAFGTAVSTTLFCIPFLGGEVFAMYMLSKSISLIAVVALVGLAVLNIVFHHLLKAPTLAGRKLLDQIDGFHMFLSATEEDVINRMSPPNRTPEVFEKYLPYAVALDCERSWGTQFAGVLAAAGQAPTQYQPSWYSGSSFNPNDFGGFASSFSSSFSSAISSSSSAPGSSGGGSGGSGGGGGGGGGGGW